MKICVYADVHGNIYALNSLMKNKDYKNSDMRVFLGDAVAMCPYPNECMEKIFNSGDIWLMGNHDGYMAFGLPNEECPFFKGDKKAHIDYMRNLAKPEFIEKLRTLPKNYETVIFGKKLFFTHYIWESENIIADNIYYADVNYLHLNELFKNINADYIFYGHEHYPSLYTGEKTFIDVGTLGMQYPGNYVMVEIDETNVKIEHKQITYDVKKLQDEIIKADYPRAKYFSSWFNTL